MALTLCSNCRLPVQESAHRCPQCSAGMGSAVSRRGVPVAAAVALVATLAVLARRRTA